MTKAYPEMNLFELNQALGALEESMKQVERYVEFWDQKCVERGREYCDLCDIADEMAKRTKRQRRKYRHAKDNIQVVENQLRATVEQYRAWKLRQTELEVEKGVYEAHIETIEERLKAVAEEEFSDWRAEMETQRYP
jgi:chromosome segregation ATPase